MNRSPPDNHRRASSQASEYLGYDSNSTFASDTFHLRHGRETPGAITQQDEPYQGVSSPTSEFASREKGWWKQQMLVDRSLTSMAALTVIFALIMVITCLSYFPQFVHRTNKHSTSVGGSLQNCKRLESTDVVSNLIWTLATATNPKRLLKAVHLLINIAATMTLGMSNTYQQLITSLKVDEIRWMMSKYEDSRVGTNSPMTIKHKKNGKVSSLLAWLLLISTSLVIIFSHLHFRILMILELMLT